MYNLPGIAWLADHPLAIMDIGVKIVIVVCVAITYHIAKRMTVARNKQEESIKASDNAYECVVAQIKDLNNRYNSLMTNYRRLVSDYDNICANRDKFIARGLEFIAETEDHQISESEFNALVQTYLIGKE